jgi:hypothetical protein
MAFIGTPLDTRNTFQSLQGKRFNGDGSTTDFTLDVAPSSTLDIEVFVGNVRQDPNSAYTLSGTTLTFTGAPPSGTNNIYVVHQAKSVGTINAPDNSVDSAQLNTALLTGATDIGANIADADLFLVDDGAGGTLRKTAASRLKTYAGFSVSSITGATALAEEPALTDEMVISDAGTLKRVDMTHVFNTPGFVAKLTSDQSISHATWTKLALATEIADKSSTFDASTNYRFSPATAGLYHVGMGTGLEGIDDGEEVTLQIYKNGSAGYYGLSKNMATGNTQTINCTTDATFLLDNDDYLEFYIYQNEGGTISAQANRTYAFAFRITGTEV